MDGVELDTEMKKRGIIFKGNTSGKK